MGNKIIAQNEYGNIKIWSEKTTYTSGEQFNGVVYLTLEKNFPSLSLNLILSGKEKVSLAKAVYESEGDGASSKVSLVQDENEFYNYNFPLFTNPSENFASGQYQFPFSFMLEETLPGTFAESWMEHGQKNLASIEYSIYAGMISKDSQHKLYDQMIFNVDQ